MVVVIIRYETTAAARWALLFIVRTFFNDAFTVRNFLATRASVDGISNSGAMVASRKASRIKLSADERLCSTDGREQLIAIDQIDERHGLLAQRMDDVMVVDDMAMLAPPLRRPAAPQGQQSRGAAAQIQPVLLL